MAANKENDSKREAKVKDATTFTSNLLLTDEEILAKGIPESCVELYRRMKYTNSYGISSWIHSNILAKYTFRSEFVEVDFATAQELLKGNFEKSFATIEELQKSKYTNLYKLANTLDTVIKTKFPNGIFIKLNSRSPKDVPIYDFNNKNLRTLLIQQLSTLPPNKQNDHSEQLMAFVKATNQVLKVSNGLDAINLLFRSTRISEDLGKIIDFGEEHFLDVKLVLREWIDRVVEYPQFEFRCFVYKKQLNAITQYFSFCPFQELIANKDRIKRVIYDFHEKIKDEIQHDNYVIDFFVCPDFKVDKTIIIELNPFHNGAGTGLFSWAKDRELFMNGPLEIRVMETVGKPRDVLPIRWARIIDNEMLPAIQSSSISNDCSTVLLVVLGVVTAVIAVLYMFNQ